MLSMTSGYRSSLVMTARSRSTQFSPAPGSLHARLICVFYAHKFFAVFATVIADDNQIKYWTYATRNKVITTMCLAHVLA